MEKSKSFFSAGKWRVHRHLAITLLMISTIHITESERAYKISIYVVLLDLRKSPWLKFLYVH